MVIQRTIENLRERPKDERRSVALLISVCVVVILFVVWVTFFFRSIPSSSVEGVSGAYEDAVANVQTAYEQATQAQPGWVSESTSEPLPQEEVSIDIASLPVEEYIDVPPTAEQTGQ